MLARESEENGFACSWAICGNRGRSFAGGEVQRPDGAIQGESVVHLSKGISKGMILREPNGSAFEGDKIITSRKAGVIRITQSRRKL